MVSLRRGSAVNGNNIAFHYPLKECDGLFLEVEAVLMGLLQICLQTLQIYICEQLVTWFLILVSFWVIHSWLGLVFPPPPQEEI